MTNFKRLKSILLISVLAIAISVSTSQNGFAATVKQTKPIAIKYTAADLDLLSRLISAEAKGESYNAQVGVGAVIVNRVKGRSFPHSINAVINQHTNGCYQFTPVQNGSIKKSAPASDVKAAKAALSGEDTTYKASYFYNGIAPNAWFLTQRVSMRINELSFAY